MSSEGTFLSVSSITKWFGGVKAVDGVSFEVLKGEILGLIGPNGAGKTTTFNLISGRFPLTSGEVRLSGQPITGLRPDRIAALGVARTFQGAKTFPQLTVRDNLETALLVRQDLRFWEDWLGSRKARAARSAVDSDVDRILTFVGMSDLGSCRANSLSYAHQSLLGIALALALKPTLLLLDEPFAGMNPRETANSAQMVRRIREMGLTVLLVEHDMPAVMGVCDRIVVLNQGVKIAEGTPAEIRNNTEVIEAYLGTDEDA